MVLITRAALAMPILAGLPALPAGPAGVGVGIGAGPVCLATIAQPGRSYSLGTVYVVNIGSGSESISLRAEPPVGGLKGQPFPPWWVSFGYPRLFGLIGQDSVSLDSGKAADIAVTLDVPPGARPGPYAAVLVAGTVAAPSPGSGGQAVFGAGAGTSLRFTVGPGGAPPPCGPARPRRRTRGSRRPATALHRRPARHRIAAMRSPW